MPSWWHGASLGAEGWTWNNGGQRCTRCPTDRRVAGAGGHRAIHEWRHPHPRRKGTARQGIRPDCPGGRNLRAMGAEVAEFEDGLDVPGGQTLHGATIDSGGDHRIAMAFSVARCVPKATRSSREQNRQRSAFLSSSICSIWSQSDRSAYQETKFASKENAGTWRAFSCIQLKATCLPEESSRALCWRGRCYAGHNGRGLDLSCRGLRQVDAIVLQGCGQHLVEACSVLGVCGMSGNQIVLCRGQIAFLQKHVGCCGRTKRSFFTSASRLCWL